MPQPKASTIGNIHTSLFGADNNTILRGRLDSLLGQLGPQRNNAGATPPDEETSEQVDAATLQERTRFMLSLLKGQMPGPDPGQQQGDQGDTLIS